MKLIISAMVLLMVTSAQGSEPVWKISKDGIGQHYVVGSVHAAKPTRPALSRRLMEIALSADVLVFELIQEDARSGGPITAMRDEAFMAEKPWIPADAVPEARPFLHHCLGAGWSQVTRSRPWRLFIDCQMQWTKRVGGLVDFGTEMLLQRLVNRSRNSSAKPRLAGLETQTQLIEALASPSDEVWIRATRTDSNLHDILSVIRTSEDGIDIDKHLSDADISAEIVNSWSGSEDYQAIAAHLIAARNERFLNGIIGMMRDSKGTAVFVIGMFHTTGPTGIVTKLREKGYKIERVE